MLVSSQNMPSFEDLLSRNQYKSQCRISTKGRPRSHSHTHMFRASKQLFQTRKSTMTAFKIDIKIISDIVCPFVCLPFCMFAFENDLDEHGLTSLPVLPR